MKNKVLFISESYLKQFSPIASNVANEGLTNSIRKAQELYIQPVLGLTLYNKLIDDIYDAGSITGLTGNYRILLEDYIMPTLTEYSLYEAIIPMTFKMVNKGVGVRNDQYQDSVGLDELKYLRNEVRNNAQFYQERLIKYLCSNSNFFPEYTVYTDDLNPDTSTGSYNSGIYFKNKRRRNKANPFSLIPGEDYIRFDY